MSLLPVDWSTLISSAVVPVVIISACGLLCLALYNRLAVILARLRVLQRERFLEYKELFRSEAEKKPTLLRNEIEQYLHFLESQVADILKKAHYVRIALGALVSAIASLLLCSLSIALSLFYQVFAFAVIVFFILGLLLMLYALYFAFAEIRVSLRPIQMESAFLQKLLKMQK